MENRIQILTSENAINLKAKDSVFSKRRVLRDISQNEPLPRVQNANKNQDTIDKKSIVASKPSTRSYKHIQAKVNSGLAVKVTKSQNEIALKPLKREESTGVLANKARNITTLNAIQNKISIISLKKSDSKENLPKAKDSIKSNQLINVRSDSNGSIKTIDISKKEIKIIEDIKEKKKDEQVVAKKSSAYSAELLEGVHDIDEGEEKSLILMSIYVKDIYLYLREMETQFPVKAQYLDQHLHMTAKMRAMLIDWLVQVHNQFSLLLETLHLTVAIIDRYLQTKPDIPRMQIQLVGITAMFIASKYEEMFPPDISDYTYITDNTYTKRDILKCEKAILKKLDFQLGRPLPIHFVRRLIKAANVTQREHGLSKYLVDLSLVDYQFVHYRPSELAAAAVCLSVAMLSDKAPKSSWSPNLVYYSGYSYGCISPIIKKMAQILSTIQGSRFTAVTNKYGLSKHGKVSSFPELANASKLCK